MNGWKMPANAIYVGRPTKWGNMYKVGRDGSAGMCVERFRLAVAGNVWTEPNFISIRKALRGKDLACWCPLDRPCHADVLLEIANA